MPKSVVPTHYGTTAAYPHLFGDNEFKIRAIAMKIAAKAYQQHLSQKKTDTTAPA